ncbi:hypothetical protein TrRE_jg7732 [Triparma retinervis]|uniref:Uncharacterized protein n=1 Tax=Triparma retinervis TaxID=2557542 RepID=A0A9W7DX55_9STRA|nr:hypothetical protein TrRE_jg7732 [Triparma retinervis]
MLLSDVGFNVEFVKPFDLGVVRAEHPSETTEQIKVLSHRNTVVDILKKSTSSGWTYIFEDDISPHAGVTLSTILALEVSSDLGFYLGVCVPHEVDAVIPPPACTGDRCCGRCAHAVALSREGRDEFLRYFDEVTHENYFDVIFEAFCANKGGGFKVYGWEMGYGNVEGHRGGFYQDRQQFETGIGG